MSFQAQTSDGKLTWIDEPDYWIGSPVAIVKIANLTDGPTLLTPTGPVVQLDLGNPAHAKYAVELLYPEATFTGDVPESPQFYEPAEPGLVY